MVDDRGTLLDQARQKEGAGQRGDTRLGQDAIEMNVFAGAETASGDEAIYNAIGDDGIGIRHDVEVFADTNRDTQVQV